MKLSIIKFMALIVLSVFLITIVGCSDSVVKKDESSANNQIAGENITQQEINKDDISRPQYDSLKTVPYGYKGIYTANDLNDIHKDLGKKYILMNDIDMKSWGNWEPIGLLPSENSDYNDSDLSNFAFTGVLDGNGYQIKSLKTIGYEYEGLFGFAVNCIIKNLGVIECKIGNNESLMAGCLVGYLIAENNRETTISNCYSSGTVMSSQFSGGLIGSAVSFYPGIPTVNIQCCYNEAKVISSDTSGGIVGMFGTDLGNANIKNCYNTGEILAKDGSELTAGGITGGVGTDAGIAIISSCYSIGDLVIPPSKAYEREPYIGGISGACGSDEDNTIRISNCYYLDKSENAVGDTKGGEGEVTVKAQALSNKEMKQQVSFSGFDFDKIWEMNSKLNRPVLLGS